MKTIFGNPIGTNNLYFAFAFHVLYRLSIKNRSSDAKRTYLYKSIKNVIHYKILKCDNKNCGIFNNVKTI